MKGTSDSSSVVAGGIRASLLPCAATTYPHISDRVLNESALCAALIGDMA
jgi:hypothetical protein